MECKVHHNTELMCRYLGERDGVTHQILYCPRCNKDYFHRYISEDGTRVEPV